MNTGRSSGERLSRPQTIGRNARSWGLCIERKEEVVKEVIELTDYKMNTNEIGLIQSKLISRVAEAICSAKGLEEAKNEEEVIWLSLTQLSFYTFNRLARIATEATDRGITLPMPPTRYGM